MDWWFFNGSDILCMNPIIFKDLLIIQLIESIVIRYTDIRLLEFEDLSTGSPSKVFRKHNNSNSFRALTPTSTLVGDDKAQERDRNRRCDSTQIRSPHTSPCAQSPCLCLQTAPAQPTAGPRQHSPTNDNTSYRPPLTWDSDNSINIIIIPCDRLSLSFHFIE